MKTLIIYLSLILLSCATSQANPIDTVDELDLIRYSGDWHQIAIIPNRFQAMCYSNTMASYELLKPNRKGISQVEVTNTCFKDDGEFNEITGKARVNPKLDSTAKLQVTFLQVFGKPIWKFVAGDYWVMDIGEDYEYVVIGEPKRKFGWVLARHLSLPKKKLAEIKHLLLDQGYNPCEFEMSRNNKLNKKDMPNLCEFLDKK